MVAGTPLPAGNAEETWLNAGAAELQPGGTERAPSEAARPEAAVTATSPNCGELKAPAPGLTPMSGDELKIWNPPPKVLAAGLTEEAIDPDEPSDDIADVTIDADEAVPDARVVPDVTTALDDVAMVVLDVTAALVAVVSDDSGDMEDEDDVTVDASACNALGIAAEPSDDTVCAPVSADVPAT